METYLFWMIPLRQDTTNEVSPGWKRKMKQNKELMESNEIINYWIQKGVIQEEAEVLNSILKSVSCEYSLEDTVRVGVDIHDSHITRLSLHLEIQNLPNSINKLSNLQILDVSDNELKHIPSEIGDLKHLTTLNLTNNQITELPESIFSLKNLKELHLRKNPLEKLPKAILTC